MRFRADWLALPFLLIALAPVHADDLGPPDNPGSAEEVKQLEEASPLEQETTEVPTGTASVPDPHPTPGPGAMKLTLDAAIQLALENNLNVEVQRFGPLIFAEDETIAWGRYDPEFFADFGYDSFKDPNAFSLNRTVGPSVDRTTDGFGGFRGLVPLLGSSYDFRFTGSRTTTNSTIQSLSPQFRSSFSLNLTQPLLRGLWWNDPWIRVKTSALRYDQSLEEFRVEVMNLVQDVENAYWELIANEEQMNVQKKSLETALALLEQSKIEYEVGVASKVKVVESEAGVAQREFELIRETNFFRTAQDTLVDLILGVRFTADSALDVQPTDRPDDYVRYDVDRDAAMQRATALRPELAIAQDRIDAVVDFRENKPTPTLPEVMAALSSPDPSQPEMTFAHWQKWTWETEDLPVGMMIMGSVDGRTLTPEEVAAYDAPFPDPAYKMGPRAMPSQVPTLPDDPSIAANRRAWEVLDKWQKPLLCAFSDNDPVTGGGDQRFRTNVPGAQGQPHVTIAGGGHFLQEGRGDVLANLVVDFIKRS